MSINYGKQSIDSNDIKEVIKVLKSDYLTQGPNVEKFENSLKKYFKSKYCCVVSNGTAGLHLASRALGWQKDDVVIVSPITFLASANCILYAEATPVFVDIDPFSYTIDPQKIEDRIKLLKKKKKKIKAIIGTDFAGNCCDWKSLKYLSNKYNIRLVNDNCHALGSKYFNDKGYAVKYADIVVHSYHPVKNITTGEGGAFLTNNQDLYRKANLLRTHGYKKSNSKVPWLYQMTHLGYNYRLTDFQCALGINQLKKLNSFILKKRTIANLYTSNFLNKNCFLTPYSENNVYHSYHIYPLLIDFKKIKKNKIGFFKFMKKHNINLQVHYIPIHYQPYYKRKFNLKKGSLPNAEFFYNSEVSLPIYPGLSISDTKKIIRLIKHYFKIK